MDKKDKLTKGQLSRMKIVAEAREAFNRKGSQITMQELAKELGEGVSYITNHFRTKEHLIVAIASEYEQQYSEIRSRHTEFRTLQQVVSLVSEVMDLQYEYRCAIIAILASSGKKVLLKQIQQNYQKSLGHLTQVLELLVQNGLLKKDILDKEEFPLFRFRYINLRTTWVVTMEMYDLPSSYRKMKPLYLKGIISSFAPYLTRTGMGQYRKLDFASFK